MKPQNLLRLTGATIAGAMLLALTPALSAQTATTYVTSALEKSRDGNYDGAIADFTKAIDLNSSYVGAYNGRALAKSKQGNFDGAIEDYSAALKLKPAFTEAYFNRGSAEFFQGNFDGAIADFTKAIELKPAYQAAYFERGLSRYCQTNLEGATIDLAKALDVKGANAEASNEILLQSALLGRRMGHGIDERLKAATGWSNEWMKALALYVSDQLSEGDLLKMAGAADADEKARQVSEALYFVGVVKQASGDKAGAKADFQKSFDGSSPDALVHRLARSELDHS
ncbi:MAG: tetratricopeptide repeat protein [Opitutaceae bacterium]